MPMYVLICHDVPNSAELRQQHRPAHLARLLPMLESGQLKLAGFTPSAHGEPTVTGSIIMADFPDDKAVQDWVSQEPFLLNGVYSHIDIKPFVQSLPAAQ